MSELSVAVTVLGSGVDRQSLVCPCVMLFEPGVWSILGWPSGDQGVREQGSASCWGEDSRAASGVALGGTLDKRKWSSQSEPRVVEFGSWTAW